MSSLRWIIMPGMPTAKSVERGPAAFRYKVLIQTDRR